MARVNFIVGRAKFRPEDEETKPQPASGRLGICGVMAGKTKDDCTLNAAQAAHAGRDPYAPSHSLLCAAAVEAATFLGIVAHRRRANFLLNGHKLDTGAPMISAVPHIAVAGVGIADGFFAGFFQR